MPHVKPVGPQLENNNVMIVIKPHIDIKEHLEVKGGKQNKNDISNTDVFVSSETCGYVSTGRRRRDPYKK